MTPKVIFRYSEIYDNKHRRVPKINEFLKSQGKKYPSEKKIKKYIKEVEKLWRKEEKRILKEISRITKMKWKRKEIICYVIGHTIPISDPLTMRLYDNKQDFIDTLTHEMIHNIHDDNIEKMKNWRKFIEKKYNKEAKVVKTHISLQAVHWNIILNLFDEKRLKRNIEISPTIDYKRAWQIVQEETPEAILKKFHEVIK